MSKIDDIKKNNRKFEEQLRKPTGEDGLIVAKFLSKYNKQLNSWIISKLNVDPSDIVLEIGYGTGETINQIVKLTSKGKVHGIDFSEVMFREAKKTNKEEIKKGKVILKYGDIQKTKYKNNQFNKIIAINVIYFLKNIKQILKNLFKAIKPGGKIVLFFYHKDYQLDRKNEGIFQNYSGEEVIFLLKNTGFTNCKFEEKIFLDNSRVSVYVTGDKV